MRWKMLTKNQNRSVSFFLTRALFLGGGMSNIFALCGKDAWISALLGVLLGIIFLYIINYCSNKMPSNLNNFCQQKTFSNIFLKMLFFFLYTLMLLVNILFLSTLVSAYYLSHTPSFLICAPIVLLLIYITSKGLKCVGRVAQIIFPLCLIVTIIKILLLTDAAELSFFLPIYTTSFGKIILGALFYATLSITPFLLLIDEKISFKEALGNYLIGTITTIFVIVNITSVLGDTLVRMFSYPEYAILRKIEFFRFFENVENILAFIWLGDLFISMSLVMNRLKNLSKGNNFYPSLWLIIIALFTTLFVENHFNLIMIIYNTFIYALFILLVLILIFLSLKIKRKNKS